MHQTDFSASKNPGIADIKIFKSFPFLRVQLSPIDVHGTLPTFNLKNADINYALREVKEESTLHQLLNDLLVFANARQSLNGPFKRILVDVKIHDLKIGECPCIPGWHLDGYQTRGTHRSNEYLLVTYGVNRTEYLEGNFRLTVPKDATAQQHMKSFQGQLLPLEGSARVLGDGELIGYNDQLFHRGPIAKEEGKRLLVRLCLTDFIPPENEKRKQ